MRSISVCFFAILFLVVSANGVYSNEKSMNAKDLFEQKCGLCHSLDRPKSKKKTAAEWESTVMRMKNNNGAPVTDEDAKMIIEYLSENY